PLSASRNRPVCSTKSRCPICPKARRTLSLTSSSTSSVCNSLIGTVIGITSTPRGLSIAFASAILLSFLDRNLTRITFPPRTIDLSQRDMLVDLHVHLRGTLTRETVLSLAQRNGTALPEEVLTAARFGWHDFPSFLAAYDLVTSVVKSAKDLE